MTIKEANNRLEKIDNDIEYWLNEKEIVLTHIGVGAVDTSREIVSGGKRVDRFVNHVINDKELIEIDKKLDELYAKKKNLEEYVEKELHRLNKYREVEQLIVYYKEQSLEEYTWIKISQQVHVSLSQCKKIYKKFKEKRDI